MTVGFDACVVIDQTTNIDLDVANGQQHHYCPSAQLGTGGQHGLMSNLCEPSTTQQMAIAIYSRYQPTVPTGPYTFAVNY